MYSKFQPVKVKPIKLDATNLGRLPGAELAELINRSETQRLALFKARIKRMRTRG